MNTFFEQVLKNINYNTDFGITIEIKDFFNSCGDIKEYKVKILEGRIYEIRIQLKNYNLESIKEIFQSFLHFIEYSNLSLYIRDEKENSIKYYLISCYKRYEWFKV